jgi:hypothetical protein
MRPDNIATFGVAANQIYAGNGQTKGNLLNRHFNNIDANNININNNNGNSNSNNNDEPLSSNSRANLVNSRNFFKSLRKPPKGIYLNYDELVNLAEVDTNHIYDQLNRKLAYLKKEIQANKQEIMAEMSKLNSENALKPFIDVMNVLMNLFSQINLATRSLNS